ncbi:lipopolysaccharide heptosyltransferase family protein [Lacihabitans sp. LS3-19]|uniref:glycosyltransferase family 9 protein n=1 Tax=Lacihabitans sp. LS3-19 TaxID=2487335 RepID=UPI0020CD687A|nr:glycosyltransferase family 9 protein [Lacihabitans sp. LS3-19]MCP9767708.1 lipopolysaccharide heptosyltransferase family protein [Lacihabitans sp. LS3-19]
MKKIIVFRFSAMGDVALVLPALITLLKNNEKIEITVVTRPKFAVFFQNIDRLKVHEVDFENQFKGISGIFRLFSILKNTKPNYVFDLHSNLRTLLLKSLFFFTKSKTFTFDKGRKEKSELVKNRNFKPLKHTTERYLDVFKRAKILDQKVLLNTETPAFKISNSFEIKISNFLRGKGKTIGIAPFAQHLGKIWPLENYKKLIELINTHYPNVKILLFGGGEKEKIAIDNLILNTKNTENLVGKFNLSEELALISKLDLMISGDSSNMHLAALSGIPVISIWGSTHEYAGFGALFQNPENSIQIPKENLECRPCSIYGNKPCARKDYACLNWITPEMVFERLKTIF